MSINTETFEPGVYTFRLQGYGGEIVLGRVPSKVYDYFRDNDIDLIEYSLEEYDEQNVPPEFQPFLPGEWYLCDEIAHETGVEMDDTCILEVIDEYGDVVWAGSLDAATLEEAGAEVATGEDIYASDQKEGTVVFYGQQFEKGTFFEGEAVLSQPFDVTKLKIICTDIEGWSICSGIEYDGVFIESDNIDTTEQNAHFAFIKILENGDTESYTDSEINDIGSYHDEEDQ